MMNKVEMLEHYINQAEEIIKNDNVTAAAEFEREVIAVYDSEIADIRNQLDCYSISHFYSSSAPDYVGDVKLLKAKLLNYYNNLRSGLYKTLMSNAGTNINVNQELHNNVKISLEQVVKSVNQIPDKELSTEDKDILSGKLASMSAAKDKESKWDKAKEILKWLGDKSVQVGIAALPYIAQAIQ